jgi:hypothetical protein
VRQAGREAERPHQRTVLGLDNDPRIVDRLPTIHQSRGSLSAAASSASDAAVTVGRLELQDRRC